MTIHTIKCCNPQHDQRQGWPGWVTDLGTQDDSTVPKPLAFKPLKLVCEACANGTKKLGRKPLDIIPPSLWDYSKPGAPAPPKTITPT